MYYWQRGMQCQQCPVLYIDLENPAYVAQDRVRAVLGEQSVPQLRVWGTWDALQPPQSGNPQLLAICEETHPLVIVDPFRYFHDGDEDSSTAMAPVMKYLRACAVCGGAVVILHHPAKAEHSKGRGSSAIRAGCDLVFQSVKDKKPMRDNNVLRRFIKPAARKLDIGFCNWQTLRRSCATWMVQSGGDVKSVQGQMRHTRATTTLDIYSQIVPAGQRRAAQRLSAYVKEQATESLSQTVQ